jgi:hypothetical protein
MNHKKGKVGKRNQEFRNQDWKFEIRNFKTLRSNAPRSKQVQVSPGMETWVKMTKP